MYMLCDTFIEKKRVLSSTEPYQVSLKASRLFMVINFFAHVAILLVQYSFEGDLPLVEIHKDFFE